MNPWLEKVLYALIPLLFSGVIYLFSTVIALQHDLTVVKNEAAIARQNLKSEVEAEVADNRLKIAVLQEQVKQLQNNKQR